MTNQEGQPQRLVLSQAELKTLEEELLEIVTGGGNIVSCCSTPRTMEGPPPSHPQDWRAIEGHNPFAPGGALHLREPAPPPSLTPLPTMVQHPDGTTDVARVVDHLKK